MTKYSSTSAQSPPNRQSPSKGFSNCTHLASITISAGVKRIEENAFWNCRRLENISVDENNFVFAAENGVLFNKDLSEIICCPAANKGIYAVPDGVREIGESAFMFCRELTEIAVPDSVTKIGHGAFQFCENLVSIFIPDSVTDIEPHAFWGCSGLVVRAKADSYAAQYVREYLQRSDYNLRFEAIQ